MPINGKRKFVAIVNGNKFNCSYRLPATPNVASIPGQVPVQPCWHQSWNKIIAAHQLTIEYVEGRTSDQILVWNEEPIRVDGQKPSYCWEPSFSEGDARLVTTIIFPCKPD